MKESPETKTTKSEKATFQANFQSSTTGTTAGQPAGRRLGGTKIGTGPGKVTYTYYPPPGATNFSVYEAKQKPDNTDGPPWVFKDRDPKIPIDVKFDLPSKPGNYSESLVSNQDDGSSSAASMQTWVTGGWGSSSSDLPGGEIASASVGAQETADVWSVTPWIYTHDVTMTTKLCQDWLDFLKEDSAFLAARMPIVAPAAITQSYPIPIVYGDVYSANLALLDEREWPPTIVLTAPVEYRPERLTFLENELPSAPGEHWVALGLSISPTTSCPPDLLLKPKPREWELRPTVYLDLGPDPRVLPIYFCYEGQNPPGVSALQMAAARIASASGADIGITWYQGQGITCLGPKLLHLIDYAHPPALSLYGSSAHSISPTETITLHHYIDVTTPMTVEFKYASTLGIRWDMYEGSWSKPDLNKPITSPIQVSGSDDIWLIAQVHTGAEGGPHTLVVTATSVMTSGISSTASDMLWVGAWVAPPGGVYLPVVLRQSS